MVNNFSRHWEYRLLPGHCLLCGTSSQRTLDLCHDCQQQLPWLEHHCATCALPLAQAQAGQDCAHCLRQPPPYRRIVAAWRYDYPVAELISQYKYHQHYAAGRVLSELFSHYLRHYLDPDHRPDLLIPTPLHWWRYWRRGFNQSLQLAERLSQTTGIPVSPCLRRRRATPPQQGLDAKQRRHNLQGAFTIRGSLTGKTVALVDDVATTTATACEISESLLTAGAKAVDIWCLARTPSPRAC